MGGPGDVYWITGGYSGGTGMAVNNSVTISGVTISNGVELRGGDTSSSTGDVFSGNALHLKIADLTVANLENFEYLNFYLPATLRAGGAMLIIGPGGTADLTEDSGLGRSSVVNLSIDGSSSPLRTGDRIVLIDASAGTLFTNSGLNTTAVARVTQGATLKYDFDILADTANNKLLAAVRRAGADERARALSAGNLAGLALVNQSAEMIAGPGMAEAVKAARRASLSTGYGLGVFGTLSGGWSRYDTGSHLDMSSLSLMTGLAWGAEVKPGFLTLGAFFEYGNGSYDTYNSFSSAASVHGDGDVYHIGGGVAGRLDFADTGPGRVYAEASFRTGGVHNEYSSSDLRDPLGRKADYDASSAYYGFHLGAGYVWNITEAASLDLYGKYFWTRLEGDSVTLSTGDPVRFKNADSSRLRLGGRFAWAVNEHVSPYAGAAWEHEFDGKARATAHGFDIDAPSLSGDTGIGELGLTLTPSASLPLYFDLGVQGYVGRREGVTGSLQVKFEF